LKGVAFQDSELLGVFEELVVPRVKQPFLDNQTPRLAAKTLVVDAG
jgi:hypothetical protein